MIKAIIFQIIVIIAISCCWIIGKQGGYPNFLLPHNMAINSILIATLGGNLYCLRAIYVNKCVKGQWDINWELWYYLRPVTSAISGLVSYIFLKAGLIALEAEQSSDAGYFGYLAFAFIAGLNVDKFVAKLEDVAKSIFGIEKSRARQDQDDK